MIPQVHRPETITNGKGCCVECSCRKNIIEPNKTRHETKTIMAKVALSIMAYSVFQIVDKNN